MEEGGGIFLLFLDFIFKILMINIYQTKKYKISEFLSSFRYTIFQKLILFFSITEWLDVNEGIWLQQQKYTQLQQLTNWWDTTPCQMTTIPGQLRQNSVPTRQERTSQQSTSLSAHFIQQVIYLKALYSIKKRQVWTKMYFPLDLLYTVLQYPSWQSKAAQLT